MENSEQANLENKKLISIETTDGCLELLRHSVVLFRQVYQIRDALGFGEHRSRMLNADVDGYRTFRDNYLKLKNHLRGVISNTEETGGGVTFETVERAQVLYNRLIQYRDRVVNFAESKGIEFVDEEVTDNELMTMEKEELPRSAVNDSSLKDMAEHTFLPEEVGTKDDFVRNVRGRLIKAVVAAGETSEYANNLLAKSLDKMPFNGRPKGEIAAEVNRVILNIYKGLGKPILSEEVKLPDTDLFGEAEPVVSEVVSEVGDIGADTDAKNKRNENRVAETPMENADTVKHEAGPVFDLKTLQDKVSQLEKSAQNAQFNLSERSEYLQLKELVKKIEILDGRISNDGLDWESDEKIRAFRLKTTNEQITFLQAQTDGLLQILNDKINQKSESFKNHFGDVMVELRNSMPELDTDFSKLESEPKIEKKTGWWDKDFQKSGDINKEMVAQDPGTLEDESTSVSKYQNHLPGRENDDDNSKVLDWEENPTSVIFPNSRDSDDISNAELLRKNKLEDLSSGVPSNETLKNNTSTSPTKTSEVLIEKEDQEVDVYTKIRNRYMKIKGDVGNLVVFDATVKDTPVYETHKRQVIKIESLLKDKRSITGNFSYIQALLNIMEEDVKKMLASIDRQSTSGESKPEKIKPKSEEEILKEMDGDIERFRLLLGADSEDNEQLATLIRIRSLVADQGEEDKTVHKTRLVPYLRVYRENLEKLEKDLQAQPSRKPKGEGLPYGIPITEAMKDNYQTSGEKLHATNAELIALDKELAENMARPGEDWVLRKRKGIWLQMDLKDLELMRIKRAHLENYQDLVKVGTPNAEVPVSPVVEFEKANLERRLAWQNETTKKRFGLLKKIFSRTTAGVAVGAVVGTMLGNGEIPNGGKSPYVSLDKMSIGQALADSGDEMPIIATNPDAQTISHDAPQLGNIDLSDSLPEVVISPEPVLPLTDSSEIIPKLSFSESTVQSGVNDNNIFSDKALQSGHDAGVELKYPENISPDNLVALEKMESNRFLVEVPHDVYWNIMEGQTNAGDLPFLSKINLDYKQALIDLVRDRIDADSELRSELGFGKDSADQTYIGEEINIELLNKITEEVAAQNNFLLPRFTLGTVAKTEAILPSGIAPVEKRQFDSPNAVEGEHKSPIESGAVIITDSVAEQFKNDLVESRHTIECSILGFRPLKDLPMEMRVGFQIYLARQIKVLLLF